MRHFAKCNQKVQWIYVDVSGISHRDFNKCGEDIDMHYSQSDTKPYATLQEHVTCDTWRQNSKLYQCNLMRKHLKTSHGSKQ